ncbi:hypothetical protein [Streptomyces luteireticuli]|uniref:hypothetical protein n=1 Tax=Streptomyces luteireticuli TaxID=173858 RepID=UPI003555F44F
MTAREVLLAERLPETVAVRELAAGDRIRVDGIAVDLDVLGVEIKHDFPAWRTLTFPGTRTLDLHGSHRVTPVSMRRRLPVACRLCKAIAWQTVDLVADGVPTARVCTPCDPA